MSKITQSDVPVVIDPVFLLSSGEWEKIAVLPDQKGYIFIYDLNGGQSLVDIARQIKQKTGLKIICLTLKVQRFYPVDKQIYDCGPREFIGYIRQAEYVVTDSFHGTAFSIIFKKKFYTYVALNHMSSRIYTLLESLNLKDRIIENKKVQEFCFEDQSLPDYARKLNEIISESKTFLQKI